MIRQPKAIQHDDTCDTIFVQDPLGIVDDAERHQGLPISDADPEPSMLIWGVMSWRERVGLWIEFRITAIADMVEWVFGYMVFLVSCVLRGRWWGNTPLKWRFLWWSEAASHRVAYAFGGIADWIEGLTEHCIYVVVAVCRGCFRLPFQLIRAAGRLLGNRARNG